VDLVVALGGDGDEEEGEVLGGGAVEPVFGHGDGGVALGVGDGGGLQDGGHAAVGHVVIGEGEDFDDVVGVGRHEGGVPGHCWVSVVGGFKGMGDEWGGYRCSLHRSLFFEIGLGSRTDL